MGFEAKILADSVSEADVRLTTVLATFPRFELAALNTHRDKSKSSASSRAVPIDKRISMVVGEPFVPESFGTAKAGMQSGAGLEGEQAAAARASWLRARDACVTEARFLAGLGVHKEYANRLLEPFSWHTVVLTATEWSNFFALRVHPDAQGEFQKIAQMIRDAMAASTPKKKRAGEWHLPFVEGAPDEEQVMYELDQLAQDGASSTILAAQISCARAARVSYLLHDGTRDIEKDIALAERLRSNGHMAPFEHAARPIAYPDQRDLRGYYELGGEGWCGNFRGWVQYRKLLPHEHDFGEYLAAVERERSP